MAGKSMPLSESFWAKLMFSRFTELLEERFGIEPERTLRAVRQSFILIFAILFALSCTVIVGFDDIFIGLNSGANLRIGSVPAEDIITREEGAFVSKILTRQEREKALAQVPTVFDPPDPNVARQQRELTEKILEFIENVRGDPYASLEEQISDINQITSLILDEDINLAILQLPEDSWLLVRSEIITVLERVMRDSIRDADLENVRAQLPTQVGLRLTPQESQIVTAILGDIIRANTFENPEQTDIDREAAFDSVADQQRQYIIGQIVAPANLPIDNLSFEALQELGLLTQTSNRGLRILRAFLASTLVMVLTGLYISRFEPRLLYADTKTMTLIAALFLIALSAVSAVRAFGTANIYLMPAAALGILYVGISTPNFAIVGAMGFAFLGGLSGRSPSFEVASLIAAANISAILTLRDAGRLNNYFIAGAIVGVTNAAVVTIFASLIGTETLDINHMSQAFLNGIVIVPTTAFAGMYALTVLLNLPTPFKLIDLSQPSKPLLQRLLREAPGTYQHSLQVANLAEQAAETIGADTRLTHVAALYHDIGKMSNPFFFTENQQHIHNPHEALNDPYRSADMIINHVVEGDLIAKKYNLPNRIREFVREHHGTTPVYVFYQRALKEAGRKGAVDRRDFSYPGPIPQSRETAILMMADSCESAIRAVKPQSSLEITELVHGIIEDKRSQGQLDDSNLTLNDLRRIEETFIDIFKGLFHPRIDYAKAVKAHPQGTKRGDKPAPRIKTDTAKIKAVSIRERTENGDAPSPAPLTEQTERRTAGVTNSEHQNDAAVRENDEPLLEVPPLPKRNGSKNSHEPQAAPSPEETDATT